MNECQNLQQQIDDYLSDRISDFARRRIENHLRQCGECANDVAEYREVIDEFRDLSNNLTIEPSLPLQYSLARMATQVQPKPQPQRDYDWAFILFGLVMLATTMITVFGHIGTVSVSIIISIITTLAGTLALGHGVTHVIRKRRTE